MPVIFRSDLVPWCGFVKLGLLGGKPLDLGSSLKDFEVRDVDLSVP